MPLKESGWLQGLLYMAFAAFAGSMGHVMRSLNAKVPVTWSRVLAEGLAAGFVGIIVMLICQAMDLSNQWTGVAVGVCGWLGATATIQMLEKIVSKKLGADQ